MTACARRSPGASSRSKQTVPHFYVSVDCELDALLALRAQLNDAAPVRRTATPAYKLSVNDMVIKAMALALRDVPDANVSWTESAMVKHKHADVGVAVSIPGGLITPIIRKAENKTLSTISNEMKDLGKRAKDRKLKPEEYQGGTTAVSNMGMLGVKDFAAVINPPHATILAVGAGEQRAVVKKRRDGKIATVMTGDALDGPPLPSTVRWVPSCCRPSSATSKTRWACWFSVRRRPATPSLLW